MRIVGFDARERWCPLERLWSTERRAGFLLRDVEKPLSTDIFVWPSVFQDVQLDLLHLDDLNLGAAGLSAPAWRGSIQDLWDDLGTLERALADATIGPFDIIAITTSDASSLDADISCSPAELDAGWELLGHDVSDRWLLSGLTNCGYAESEHQELRARWGPRLNQHHLFTDENDAVVFARGADTRVREHAPFLAWGVWRRSSPGRPGTPD